MGNYKVIFKEVTLKEAVNNMGRLQYFYTFEIGSNLYPLDLESLPSVIKRNAILLTMISFIEADKKGE